MTESLKIIKKFPDTLKGGMNYFMLRATIQRSIILDTLKEFKTHPSAETLFEAIHKKHPAISKATVYRNLKQMTKYYEINQIAVVDDSARYDGNTKKHYHGNCKICGMVFDVEMDYFSGIDEQVQNDYGFFVDRHDTIFVGTCKNCFKRVSP